MSSSLQIFKPGPSGLSAREKKVVEKLTAAAKLIVPLYEAQKNSKYPGANFYPSDATREEIQKAAKKNPSILSPYTFVERNKAGKLVAVPYSKRFRKELTHVAKLLKEAAALSDDKAFKAYLVARAQDLLKDNFDKSNILWLKTNTSKIGCVLGPFDRFLDRHFHQKRAYTAWIGVLNEDRMAEVSRMRTLILTSIPTFLPGAKKTTVSQIRVRAEDTLLLAGLDADYLFMSNNLPSSADIKLIKKHGTMSTVFLSMAKLRVEKWMQPIFQRAFDKKTQEGRSVSQMQDALVRISVIDEMRRSLVRYDDAVTRLQEYFAYIDEVYGDILTIKSAGFLYLKNAITEKDLEAMVLAEICQALYYLAAFDKRRRFENLLYGYAAFLDALLGGGGLEETEGGLHLNLQKALLCTDRLVRTFEYYLALGTREEIKGFFECLNTEGIFSKFHPHFQALPQIGG
ncbi:MAG: hypothetical protein HYT49_00935 [Candidatus Wildermuthbacteria bacterium]|nr:hypothetical protein [Candidatus Wildermuthbacteria bacterium]